MLPALINKTTFIKSLLLAATLLLMTPILYSQPSQSDVTGYNSRKIKFVNQGIDFTTKFVVVPAFEVWENALLSAGYNLGTYSYDKKTNANICKGRYAVEVDIDYASHQTTIKFIDLNTGSVAGFIRSKTSYAWGNKSSYKFNNIREEMFREFRKTGK
tara:strand:- start:386 stop:859 length:474 start_codon:yes stop_codon:yes gene_type:complete